MWFKPFNDFTRITNGNTICRNRFGDDTSRTDYTSFSNGDTGKYYTSSSNPNIVFYYYRQGSCPEIQFPGGFIPFFYKTIFKMYIVVCCIELNIGCDKDSVTYIYVVFIHHRAVVIDDCHFSYENVFSTLACKVVPYVGMFPYFTKHL